MSTWVRTHRKPDVLMVFGVGANVGFVWFVGANSESGVSRVSNPNVLETVRHRENMHVRLKQQWESQCCMQSRAQRPAIRHSASYQD
jgi:hypothetical protein